MPQYVGFSTQSACHPKNTNNQMSSVADNQYSIPSGLTDLTFGNKFTLYDEQLVIQDFINALNIPLGSKVGRPEYGTSLWSFLFEPNTVEIQQALETEIRRVASRDPRIILGTIKAFPQDKGILVEVEIAVNLFNNPVTVSLYFNQQTNRAVQI